VGRKIKAAAVNVPVAVMKTAYIKIEGEAGCNKKIAINTNYI
jgi:hypothetical protein